MGPALLMAPGPGSHDALINDYFVGESQNAKRRVIWHA